MVSQKCQYALRALLELAARSEREPVSVTQLAASQAIPARFLELILGQLRQGGFVRSHRGRCGGYVLVRPSLELTVGEVIRFIDGPVGPVKCVSGGNVTDCTHYGHCVFLDMWSRAQKALANVYNRTTLADLVDRQRALARQDKPTYCI